MGRSQSGTRDRASTRRRSRAVVFDALQSAQARGVDVLICRYCRPVAYAIEFDGRAEESETRARSHRCRRAARSIVSARRHQGQNALQQAKLFHEALNVTGVVVTKLDGTAKGGVMLALAGRMKLPLRFIGIGETAEDFAVFEAEQFVDALLQMAHTKT